MQHPEEGTIHSWLDGQLPLTEAAEVEAHVAACPACGAVVAEARGFIAASSRILIALDDAPRGVIPAAAPRPGNRRAVLRAAAAVFVVAAGSFVVLNRTGTDASRLDSTASKQAAPLVENEGAIADSGAPLAGDAATATGAAKVPASPPRAASPPPALATVRNERSRSREIASASRSPAQLQDLAVSGPVVAPRAADNAASSPAAVVSEAAVASAAPRVVRSDSTAGTRRTVYEVGAGNTVTLTETSAEGVQFSESDAVVGMAGGAVQPAQRMEKARAVERRAATTRGTAAAAATAPPPPPMPPLVMAINTISWVDPGTRKRLTLSGPFTVEELRAIRARLDALKTQERKETP